MRLLSAATSLWLLLPIGLAPAFAQDDSRPRIRAERATPNISIDGRLSEDAWGAATPASVFRQIEPDEGQMATERTEVRILFDATSLYVGVRLLDREPSRIVPRLSRRDASSDADRFTLYFDPYHDHLTGALFEVSAAGVQRDAIISNDTSQDETWDAVWESAVSIDDEGWSLEM